MDRIYGIEMIDCILVKEAGTGQTILPALKSVEEVV